MGLRIADLCLIADSLGVPESPERGVRVIANDLSEAMAALAAKAVPAFDRIVVASAANGINESNMGIKAGSLDAVLLIGSLHSIPSRGELPGSYDEEAVARVLVSAHAALKPGGVLPIFFLPTVSDPDRLAKLNQNTTPLDPVSLQRQLEEAGFEVKVNKPVIEAYTNVNLGTLNYQVIEAVKR
jgi:SAM-dependent methyltransferase